MHFIMKKACYIIVLLVMVTQFTIVSFHTATKQLILLCVISNLINVATYISRVNVLQYIRIGTVYTQRVSGENLHSF